MDNYSVVSKGEYKHKQTSEHLEIVRFLVVRNKQKRYLLLDFDNKNAEKLTGLRLQIDQYDGRGNYLGVKDVEFKDLSKENGRFILKERIDVHHACVDFFVKIAYAEYGDYKYCLDKNGTYAVYDRKVKRQKVSKATVEKNVGKEGHRADTRRFSSPLFVRVLSVIVMLAIIAVSAWQVVSYTKDKESFFLDNVIYEFVENGDGEKELTVVGFKGFGGGKLVINDELAGYRVTSIQAQAFKDNGGVKSLTVNGNVYIEAEAFKGCENLNSIKLNGVTNVGMQAFSGCNSLKTVEISECEVIGARAFKDCQSLQDVVIHSKLSDRVLSLGEYAFADCKDIGNVKIDQFIQMGEYVDYFSGAQTMKSLYLKNYNYAPYEVDAENVNKGIVKLFGGADDVALGSLTIKYCDTIPDNFTNKVSGALESFTVENLNTTIVGEKAFKDCTKLHTFSVNTKITEVKESAFENTAITSFDAKELRTLAKNAFSGCSSLASFNLGENTVLTTIPEGALKGTGSMNLVIPATITSIESGAFEDSKVKTVTFATDSEITSIPYNAFKGCAFVKEITLPQTVKTIGEQAFNGCSSLKAMSLPFGLTHVGTSAFEDCSALVVLDIPNSVTDIGTTAFRNNSALTELVIPDSVVSIGACVLDGCNGLQTLTVPFLGGGVGSGATVGYLFSGYNQSLPEKLSKIKITKDTVVGEGAFEDCVHITEFDISNQTQRIEDRAFANCYDLRYFVIPENTSHVSNNSFENCYKLFEIENHSSVSVVKGEGIATYALAVYTPSSSKLKPYSNNGYKFLRSEDVWYLTDIPQLENLTLPSSTGTISYYVIPKYFFFKVKAQQVNVGSAVKSIGDRAFANTDIENVTISVGKIELGEQVFVDSRKLAKVDLSSSRIENIPENTFYNCIALEKVSLPNTVTKIGDRAFAYCENLKEINVPQQLNAIGQSAFEGCRALVEFNASNTYLFTEIGDYVFDGCSNLKKLVLPNTLDFIGEGILRNCYSVEQLSVPFFGKTVDENSTLNYLFMGGSSQLKTVKLTNAQKVGENAFSYWTSITEVYLADTVTEIGAEAFNNCTSLEKINTPSSLITIGDGAFSSCHSLTEFNFAEGIAYIGYGAFSSTAIKNVKFPDSLSYLGPFAFNNCGSLDTVDTGDGLRIITEYTFQNSNVKKFIIGDSLEQIGDFAFNGCTKLENVTFSYNLSKIGRDAFSNCNSLTNIELPSSLTTLGEYAFSYCYSLETVNIGNGLTEISANAFNDSGVKTVYLGTNVKRIGSGAFAYCDSLEVLTLNSKLEVIETEAFYATNIKTLDLPSSLKEVYGWAFAYCNSLEEVTVRSSIDVFNGDAFYESNKIYQVNDMQGSGISRKNVDFGGVAKNAILVNKYSTTPKLQKTTIGNVEYRYASGVCGVVKVNGYNENLTLGAITIGGVTYDNVYVTSYATQYNNFGKLTITSAVKDIYPNAFYSDISLLVFDGAEISLTVNAFSGYVDHVVVDDKLVGLERYSLGHSYPTVYYTGSSAQWNANPNRYNFDSRYYPNYYYSKCFHNYYESKWNYDEYGNINTSYQDYDYRELKKATCTEKGQGEYYCDICNYSDKFDLYELGHEYIDYICYRCGAIEPVVVDRYNFGVINESLLTFTEGEGSIQMFDMTDNQAVKIVDAEENSKHSFTVQAKVDLTLSFSCDFSTTDIGTLTITKEKETPTVLDNDKSNVTYTLKAGQKITFEFARNESSASNTYVKIKQFSIK